MWLTSLSSSLLKQSRPSERVQNELYTNLIVGKHIDIILVTDNSLQILLKLLELNVEPGR